MRDGFLKVAAATPEVRVADCAWNRAQTAELMRQAAEQGVKVVCFPELGLTGYTCADLFLQSTLLRGAERALEELMAETKDLDLLACVGVPVRVRGKLYNCAAVFCRGELLGLVPKTNIPNYTEFYEGRWFTGGAAFGDTDFCIAYAGQEGVEFSTALVFRCASFPALTVGVEICEDVWVADTPSTRLCAGGATLILNPSASDEIVSKAAWRRTLLSATSGRLACGYVYADAGWGESSTDLIYAGHDLILENGSLLAERRFGTGLTVSEIDLEKLEHERQRMNTFPAAAEVYPVYFELEAGAALVIAYQLIGAAQAEGPVSQRVHPDAGVPADQLVAQQCPAHKGDIHGAGDVAVGGQTGAVQKVGMLHTQLLRPTVHPLHKGALTAGHCLPQCHRRIVSGGDCHRFEQIVHTHLLPLLQINLASAHPGGMGRGGHHGVRREQSGVHRLAHQQHRHNLGHRRRLQHLMGIFLPEHRTAPGVHDQHRLRRGVRHRVAAAPRRRIIGHLRGRLFFGLALLHSPRHRHAHKRQHQQHRPQFSPQHSQSLPVPFLPLCAQDRKI